LALSVWIKYVYLVISTQFLINEKYKDI
jgi:hypothetical protein